MRTETITRKLYTFDELSETAKEKARDWYRDGSEYFWTDENKGSLNAFCDLFGIEPNWEVSSWGYSYCYPKYREYNAPVNEASEEEISGLRLRTYLLNNYGHVLTIGKPYGKYERVNGVWRYKRRSRVLFVTNDCPFTGYCMDESLLAPIRAFIENPDSRTYSELIQDCLDSWLSDFRADLEYQYSDEFANEGLSGSDYEFTETGEPA